MLYFVFFSVWIDVSFREYVPTEELHSITLALVQIQTLEQPSHPVHSDYILQVLLIHESLLGDLELFVLGQVTLKPL